MKEIKEIYVVVNINEQEMVEGICSNIFNECNVEVIAPMICSNNHPELLDKIKYFANDFSKSKNKIVKLLKFTCREEIEIIDERN